MDFASNIGRMVAAYQKYCETTDEPVSLSKYMLGKY